MNFILALAWLSWSIARADGGLAGVWKSGCHPIIKHSYTSIVIFQDGSMDLLFQLYADRDCKTNSVTVIQQGSYAAGGPWGDGTEINLKTDSVRMLLHLPAVVDQYNRLPEDGCGLTNWKLDTPQDVTGLYCRPVQYPAKDQMLYDIFRLGADLRFGLLPEALSARDPAARPEHLNATSFSRIY